MSLVHKALLGLVEMFFFFYFFLLFFFFFFFFCLLRGLLPRACGIRSCRYVGVGLCRDCVTHGPWPMAHSP